MRDRSLHETALHGLAPRLERIARELVFERCAAEDLVQDAWVEALRADAEPLRHPVQWMRVVMRRKATRQRRRALLREEGEVFSARFEAHDDEQVERASTAAFLLGEVAQLDSPYREVIEARFLEERTIRSISEGLARPEDTVRTQLRRGLSRLRERLDKRSGSREVWAGMLLQAARVPRERALEWAQAEGVRRAALSALPGGAALAWFALLLVGLAATLWSWPGEVAATPEPAVAALQPRDPGLEEELLVLASESEAPTPLAAGGAEPVAPTLEAQPEAAPDPLPADVVQLTVLVEDALGNAVEDAWVELIGQGRRFLHKGDAPGGRLELALAQADLVRVWFLDGGVVLSARSPSLAWSDTITVQLEPGRARTLRVTLDAPASTIFGSVVDLRGEPVPAAIISASSLPAEQRKLGEGMWCAPKMVEKVTDAEGRFRIEGLAPVDQGVRIAAAGHPASGRIARPVPADSTQPFRFAIPDGGIVAGFAIALDGTPAVGARVWAGSPFEEARTRNETRADGDGFFLLSGLPEGPQWVFACDPDDPSLFAFSALEIEEGEEFGFDAALAPTTGVRVRVLDAEGEPAQGVLVVASALRGHAPWTEGAQTDGEGRAELLHVPDADLELRAYPGKYQGPGDPGAHTTGVRPSAEELVLRLGPERVLDGELAGRVLSQAGTALTEGEACAFLEDFSKTDAIAEGRRFGQAGLQSSSLDEQGGFLFQGLPDGIYRAGVLVREATGSGWVDAGRHLVRLDERFDLGVLRAPSATRVRLVRTATAPRTPRVQLSVFLDPYWRVLAEEEFGGEVELSLFPGRYRANPGIEVPPLEFEVLGGETQEVRFTE